MRTSLLSFLLFPFLVGCAPYSEPPTDPTVVYLNGFWFDGEAFVPRTMYVANGVFVTRPARVGSTVDLVGAFVVPPFAEAHNHNVEPSSRIAGVIASYLDAGVFYVQNPNNLPGARAALAGHVNTPGSLDVTFSDGGLTGPGGHPAPLAALNVRRGIWRVDDGEGAFYHTVTDTSSLDAAWSSIAAGSPDFIKVYLLYASEYAERLSDPSTVGWRGIDPALMPEVMRRARDAGLRVATHVETADDFRIAVEAGVDQIAHMPGFRGDANTVLGDLSPFLIRDNDARRAASQGTVVVTTLSGLARHADAQNDEELRTAADQLNRENLATLRRHGVLLAIGSDNYGDHSVTETLYLHELGIFSKAELLDIWTRTTPSAIFPGRRIGRLEPGFEASFLVLDGDPLEDFTAVNRITMRVKQGAGMHQK